MKNSSDIIGNRNRDLLACNAVPQPTAPPRTSVQKVRGPNLAKKGMWGKFCKEGTWVKYRTVGTWAKFRTEGTWAKIRTEVTWAKFRTESTWAKIRKEGKWAKFRTEGMQIILLSICDFCEIYRRESDTFLAVLNKNDFVMHKDRWNFGSNERFGKLCVLIH